MDNKNLAMNVYGEFQERLEMIEEVIDEMKSMVSALMFQAFLVGEGAAALIEDAKKSKDEDKGYDFEGEGILSMDVDGNAKLITCEAADAWLDKKEGSVKVSKLQDLPYIAAFDKKEAIYSAGRWCVCGEILVFAIEGKKVRPLQVNEICEISLYFEEHKAGRMRDGKIQTSLVLM